MVQFSVDLFRGCWGDDGEWMLGIVGGYSDNQGDSCLSMIGICVDNQNYGYVVGLILSWFQYGKQKQGVWLDNWLQYVWFSNDVFEYEDGIDYYYLLGIIVLLEVGYQWLLGCGVVIELQVQVIYQGVQQDDFIVVNCVCVL